MNLVKLITIAVVTLLVVFGLAQDIAGADRPGYVVLSSPAPAELFNSPAPRPVYRAHRQAYAYGWFGATPGSYRARSFGYYGRHSTWIFP